MSETFSPQSRDDIHQWLTGMDPLERAMVTGLLMEQATVKLVGAVRHQATWELSRERGARRTAELLGVSESSVRNSITFHNRAVNSQVAR